MFASLGGGVAAAAVFAVVTKGTLAGLLLAHLAPLPLMIVALGFGLRHGATSALIAAGLLSIWPNPVFGLAYAGIVAIPAMLACLCRARRAVPRDRAAHGDRAARRVLRPASPSPRRLASPSSWRPFISAASTRR